MYIFNQLKIKFYILYLKINRLEQLIAHFFLKCHTTKMIE